MTAREEIGRAPVQLLRLYLDYCNLDYGIGECTARLGVTGSHKCFNTRATCQAPGAYPQPSGPDAGKARAIKEYTFITPVAGIPADKNYIPSLRKITFSPMQIDPGKSLGRRGQVTCTLQDHPHHDVLIDKYVDEREYDPLETGTYWTKLKNRNIYYNSRLLTCYSGYMSQIDDIEQMDKRTYVIDQINGPDGGGRITITGRDILRLADDKRAVCPVSTIARLDRDISKAEGSPISFDVVPAGEAVDNFSLGDYIRINKEIFIITGILGDELTVSREQFTTEAKDHKTDDTVQLCKRYLNEPVHLIMYDLLTNFANIPAEFIDFDEWIEEAGSWLTDFRFTGLIADPVGVTKLIDELIECSTSYIYWNELEQKIKLVAVKPPEVAPKLLSDDNALIEGSIVIKEKPDERITRLILYYNQVNPVEKLDEWSNYSNREIRVDLSAEAPVQFGDTRERIIYSRWITTGSFFAIETLMQRLIAKYRNTPAEVSFKIDAKDLDVWTGDLFTLRHRNIVDIYGVQRDIIMRVIEISESIAGTQYSIRAVDSEREFAGRYCYFQDEDEVSFSDATPEQREFKGGWFCDATLLMPDGSDPYLMP